MALIRCLLGRVRALTGRRTEKETIIRYCSVPLMHPGADVIKQLQDSYSGRDIELAGRDLVRADYSGVEVPMIFVLSVLLIPGP